MTLCGLNLIWLALSLPVITIGASTASLHYALYKLENDEAGVIRSFFSGWKKCWKQASLLWGLLLVMFFFLFMCFRILSFYSGLLSGIAICVMCIPALFLAMIACYSLPMISRFELTFMQVVSDSILFGIAYFPRSLLIVFLNILPFLLLRFAPATLVCVLFVWLPIGFSAVALFIQRLINPILVPYE